VDVTPKVGMLGPRSKRLTDVLDRVLDTLA
jgi:hypothetical protein